MGEGSPWVVQDITKGKLQKPGTCTRGTWATAPHLGTTACVANSLLSTFVQHGCLTWPRIALGKDTSLHRSPAMKMDEQRLTLGYFYSPRAVTSVKGEGEGVDNERTPKGASPFPQSQ